ncbi:Uncharacterised protein [Halioglobus japonicus]|nr:Uncharacterised protein [Halioglobus japonicus]
MTRISVLRLAAPLFAAVILTACVSSKPIESTSAVDDRPVLFFTVDGTGSSSEGLAIYVDDLYMGDAENFSAKKKGLVVLPGTHIVEIRNGTQVLTSQKVYVSSGVSKTIHVQYN